MNYFEKMSLAQFLMSWVVFIGLFFLARHLLCWFFKINKMVALLDAIAKELKGYAPATIEKKTKVKKMFDCLLPAHAASRMRAAMDAFSRKHS